MVSLNHFISFFFFFNDTATTEIYTLSLHDALPICGAGRRLRNERLNGCRGSADRFHRSAADRKSTRLNSSHGYISYAVFCLKKKKQDEFLEMVVVCVRQIIVSVIVPITRCTAYVTL